MANSTAPAANGGGSPPTLTAVAAPGDDDRPAEDILSRSLRVTLGGKEYVLAVLFIAGNERWREYERSLTTTFVEGLEEAGHDGPAIAARFAAEPELWLDLLYAYDTDMGRRKGVLPPRDELKERIYEDEPEAAIREVVKAANPKAEAAVRRLTAEAVVAASLLRLSTSPKPTAGRRRKSAKH